MEAIIDSLKKAGKIFYPKTKTKAVYDDNNNRLDNTLTGITDSLTDIVKVVELNYDVMSFGASETKSSTKALSIPSGYKVLGVYLRYISAGLAYNTTTLSNNNTQATVSLSNWYSGTLSGACGISVLCIRNI